MKGFGDFFSEARTSQASEKAKKLGLKGDGHGGWYDRAGEFKGSRRMFLYVAITRSRFPSTNFCLFTEAKTKSELIKLILSGKRPGSYKELNKFLGIFNNSIEK